MRRPGGQTPRDIPLTPDGSVLVAANQHGGGLVTFAIDTGTGGLTAWDGLFDASKPVCVKFRSRRLLAAAAVGRSGRRR